MENSSPKYMTTFKAEAYLRTLGIDLTRQYLARLRCQGRGPAYMQLGRKIYYERKDIDRWLAGDMPRAENHE